MECHSGLAAAIEKYTYRYNFSASCSTKGRKMSIGIGNGTIAQSNAGSNSGSSNYSQNWSSSMGSGQWASALSQANAQTANDFNRQSMREMMAFNQQEAQKQRDWEEQMSNTAVQRATRDMIAAGINPILAAGASASTPSGASASTSALSANMAREYTDYESQGYGEGSSWGSSWEHSESVSGLAQQAQGLVGGMADLIGKIKDTNSGKKISSFLTEVKDGIQGKLWNLDQNVKSVKQWLRNTIGLDK